MPDDEVFHDPSADGGSGVIAIRVIIEGRVQKVGLRQWIKQKANSLGIDGWVRNRMNDTVEALFVGPEEDVREIIKLCYQGPSFAFIRKLREFPQADIEGVTKGFVQLPTV